MNLFETVELIQGTAKEAVELKLLAIPNDPEKHLLVGAGKHEVINTPFVSPPRRHVVESLESFAAAYARWCLDGEDIARKVKDGEDADMLIRLPNIWLDLAHWRLQFYTDEPIRRAWVRLQLTPSPQLKTLQRFANEVALEQKALVRLLRHDLADCVDAGVLAAFRSVDFQKIQSAKQVINHEKQSLDADIVAQVTGEKKPDFFTVNAPLFAMKELDARCNVHITIDIDCDNRKFQLQAKPGHLEMAMDDARAAVLTALENDLTAAGQSDVTILAGCPGDTSER